MDTSTSSGCSWTAGLPWTRRTSRGPTPLFIAACHDRVAVVRLLIERRATLDATGGYGLTPLHCAAAHGRAAIARLLIEAGARVDAVANGGATPLHLAVKGGHAELVQLLLRGGAAQQADAEGLYPVDYAVLNARHDLSVLFRTAGAQSGEPERQATLPRNAGGGGSVRYWGVR
jgi:ankyrin repeat protein